MMNIAIIGAGLAGLTAACELTRAGHKTTVFDKSKGTGGRLSSRSYASGWIDHGAPYLTMISGGMESYLRKSPAASKIVSWSPQFNGCPNADEKSQLIGVPRNSAITRGLLEGIRFQPSTRIGRLERTTSGWRLFNDGESLLGCWDDVIIAIPSPQALALLREWPAIAGRITKAQMEPCWVAAIHCNAPLPGLVDVNIYEHPVVRRITRNSAKDERNNSDVYVVQAQRDWSQKNLEKTGDLVGATLLQQFVELTDGDCTPELLFVHRWRYAFTKDPLGEACLWDENLRLGVCGDWCLGRTAEHAWESGMALAQRIIAE
ncbi:MAG: hypothetical protein C0622_11225 [Desulfuromonas sp.]|nr:MAG: hypothetical protein C0622_11225 [Desulfuromonas sp.]